MACKIGIISDIHFGKFSRTGELVVPGETIQDQTAGALPLLQGASEILKQESISYLFVAGDLTSIASPQEYYYCEKKIIELAEMCGVTHDNIVFCPGNHDVDWNIVDLAQKYTKNNISPEVEQIITEKYQRIAATTSSHIFTKMPIPNNGVVPFSGVIERDEFIAFILNTGLYCKNQGILSHGKLGLDQLSWLKDTLGKFKNDLREKIVLMHHHPIDYTYPFPIWEISHIEENSDFVHIIGENDITLVIHGHRHHPIVKTLHDNEWMHEITFLCAGSFSVNADHRANGEIPNTLHILELGNRRGIYLLHNYVYSSSQGWQPVSHNDPNVPLDYQMRIGKIIDEETAISLISRNYKDREGIVKWNDLSEELKFLSFKTLNELFKKVLKPKYSVFGNFPEDVYVIKVSEAIK